jgi:hypothetical protein
LGFCIQQYTLLLYNFEQFINPLALLIESPRILIDFILSLDQLPLIIVDQGIQVLHLSVFLIFDLLQLGNMFFVDLELFLELVFGRVEAIMVEGLDLYA